MHLALVHVVCAVGVVVCGLCVCGDTKMDGAEEGRKCGSGVRVGAKE